jgi:ABC-2 type transport system ATP-binding protein
MLTQEQGVTVFMSSHILAEVARLAQRVGIIHDSRLLQELDAEELNRNRRRRLLVRARDVAAALRALSSAGQPARALPDGTIELATEAAVAGPVDIVGLLSRSGVPPAQLLVEGDCSAIWLSSHEYRS